MKKMKVFEFFAGIGSQKRALENIDGSVKNKGFEIIGTSEWYIDGIIAYDTIHNGPQEEFNKYNELKLNDMIDYISKFTLSKDSKNQIERGSINKFKYEKIRRLYIALIRNKNYGSIVDISAKKLPKIDLLTYSFPCQDISIIGKQKGINKEDQKKEKTRSGLLWEIERLLIEMKDLNKLPKFLLMENVKALLQKNHLKDWLDFDIFLQGLGYKNTTVLLNALDFGVPQSRERVFVISELNATTNISVQKKEQYKKGVGIFLDWDKKEYKEEHLKCILNDTKSRRKMWDKSKKLYKNSDFFLTLTTKLDRFPNCGNIYYPNKIDGKGQFRLLTAREALMLMGFKSTDYDSLKNISMSDTEIYKQSGNSIVVNVLESIFTEIMERF
jgi:DNA (cytosine-5)-methyltransferase 1